MKKIIIMGAAGRDFHNFNVYFRDNPEYEVVAFTAIQIPNIEGRIYPKELAGKLYKKGIPIFAESELPKLIKKHKVDEVVFSYSDVSHEYVMHRASLASACGANFVLLGAAKTMLKSRKPVISVCAVRTGSGKSQTSRKVFRYFKNKGKKVVAVRHPMPYGDLKKQICQRFSKYSDFEKYDCTIEEREEYEPYIEQGLVVYAGVDYAKILSEAEKEADLIVWDGGNNDTPFYKPDLHIVVCDPHRAGHEIKYHPGETNFLMADVLVINKVNTAKPEDIGVIREHIKELNPDATVILANSVISVENPELLKGKKALVIEDGPTVTHGEMAYGAGFYAAKENGAQIIEPKPYAVGSIKETFVHFPHLKNVLPAMGYGDKQIKELEKTINNSDAEVVVIGTPVNLKKLLKLKIPAVRVTYDIVEIGHPNFEEVLSKLKI